MSLINDAIKQAHKANKERQSNESLTATGAGMQSADARPAPTASGSMSGMLIIAGIVVFVLLGGALLFLSLRDTPLTTDLDGPTTTIAAPPVTPVASSSTSNSPTAVEPILRADPTASALNNPVPTPVVEPASAAVAANTPPPTPAGPRPFPELKLQGIYYRLTDPSVMINGKALEIGDLIEEARVIKIERKEVTLELDGQQKVLRLQ